MNILSTCSKTSHTYRCFTHVVANVFHCIVFKQLNVAAKCVVRVVFQSFNLFIHKLANFTPNFEPSYLVVRAELRQLE
jgi:hypothetical protein